MVLGNYSDWRKHLGHQTLYLRPRNTLILHQEWKCVMYKTAHQRNKYIRTEKVSDDFGKILPSWVLCLAIVLIVQPSLQLRTAWLSFPYGISEGIAEWIWNMLRKLTVSTAKHVRKLSFFLKKRHLSKLS